jgi:UDP-glucose 4-epimerase
VQRLLAHPEVTQVIAASRKPGGSAADKLLERPLNIENADDAQIMLRKHNPDVIFHLAANPNTKAAGEAPWHTNVHGTFNLLAGAPRGCRFVLASSATVYGNDAGFRRSVEDHPVNPNSIYGASKVAAEALVQASTHLGGVRGLILRYVANVGGGATHGLLPDVVRKLKGGYAKLELFGNEPGSTKPFMHVSDTVAATVSLAFSDAGGVWNIAGDNSASVLQVAEVTMQALGITKEILWLGLGSVWAGDNPIVRVSNCKLLRNGFSPKYRSSLEAIRQAARELDGGWNV